MPCCLVFLLALLFPRVILIVTWILNPAFINNAYSSWVLPVLGLIFLPMTTLAYALATTFEGGATNISGVIVIALAVLNALAPGSTSFALIASANILVWVLTLILDRVWAIRHVATKVVVYDRVDLLHEGKRDELIRDLEMRTGVEIVRIEIGKVDLLRDTAVIKVHFDGDKQPGHFEGASSDQ